MVNRVWNYVLLFLAVGLFLALIFKGVHRMMYARYEYYLHLSQEDGINVQFLENSFTTKDNTLDVPNGEDMWRVDQEYLPQMLHLLWFNYDDNKFYEFDGATNYEQLQRLFDQFQGSSSQDVTVKLGKKNHFDLLVNDELVGKFEAKEVQKPWFDTTINREMAVFFTTHDRKFQPRINLESTSQLLRTRMYNSMKHFQRGYGESFESDSLVNRQFVFNGQDQSTSVVDAIMLELANPNYRHKVGNTEYNDHLVLTINLDQEKLYNIIKNDSSPLYNLELNLNDKDSLKSVRLIHGQNSEQIGFKVNYGWE